MLCPFGGQTRNQINAVSLWRVLSCAPRRDKLDGSDAGLWSALVAFSWALRRDELDGSGTVTGRIVVVLPALARTVSKQCRLVWVSVREEFSRRGPRFARKLRKRNYPTQAGIDWFSCFETPRSLVYDAALAGRFGCLVVLARFAQQSLHCCTLHCGSVAFER